MSSSRVRWLNNNGYPDAKSNKPLRVRAEDLSPSSSQLVKIICDMCHIETELRFSVVTSQLKTSNYLYCRKCTYGNWRRDPDILTNPIYNKDWLYQEYIVKGRTAKDIAQECSRHDYTVEKMVAKYGFKKPKKTHEEIIPEEILYDLYCVQQLSANKIADMYKGIDKYGVNNLVSKYGFTVQEKYESTKAWWKKEENRARMSELRKNFWTNEDFVAKKQAYFSNPEVKKYLSVLKSATYQGISVEEWSGYITPERTRIRASAQYDEWRRLVYARDDYTCRCCGSRSSPNNYVILNAHHIKSFSRYPELRFDVNNGITLCDKCHSPRFSGSLHHLYGTQDVSEEQLWEYIYNHQATA